MEEQEFEKEYLLCRGALERFVYYRMPNKADAEDILQEVALTAFKNFETLKNPEKFKAWLLKIAHNKCNDFYRKLKKHEEIPFDEMTESIISRNRYGFFDFEFVHDTMSSLGDKDKHILFLYYWGNKKQDEIARQLSIPIGTVKSRLHTAKHRFKEAYPFPPVLKGVLPMKAMPKIMPEYKITASKKEPFPVKWEEMMGWFIVPKLGEKITWAMYDFPEKKRSETYHLDVIGHAYVHGIKGVRIDVKRQLYETKADRNYDMYFVAQLNDTHTRFLAESHYSKDREAQMFFTFLDTEIYEDIGSFTDNWGFGEDNCGNETNPIRKGLIIKNSNEITCLDEKQTMDVVGCYTVDIGGKSYDTICIIDVELYNNGVLSEQYVDENGKTVIWRRFNKNDWRFDHYQKLWSEKFPENEQISVNGEIYVHWYDCITDYILPVNR